MNAIGQVRKDVKARLIDSPEKTWSAVLGAAIAAHNERMNTAMRDSPDDVGKDGNEELQCLQISDSVKRYAHNNKLAKKGIAKVKDMGGFRKPLKAKALKRGVEATYGTKIEIYRM